MAADRKGASIPGKHSVLGPAVSIPDDRRQALGSLFAYLAFALIGLMGLYIGRTDLDGGSALLGLGEIAAGLVVVVYCVRAVIAAAGRLRHPIALVVGRDGFEYFGGDGPVSWEEVAAIGDPVPPPRAPKALRVHLQDPADYVVRHAMSPVARVILRIHRNDLLLGRDTLMPVEAVHALMCKRLAEYRRGPLEESETPPVRAPKRRRAALRH